MQRPVFGLLALAGGVLGASCGTLEDEGIYCTDAELEAGDPKCGRPLELEYITVAILAPSCGQAQCHSRFRQAGGLSFSNPEDARRSLVLPNAAPLLSFTSEKFDPLSTGGPPNLIRWVTEIDPFGTGIGRMPFDAPLPNRDIDLLEVWIRAPRAAVDSNGNTIVAPGGSARGAQCNPELFGGFACRGTEKVRCNSDGNFDEDPEEDCSDCNYDLSTEPAQLVCVP